VTGEWANSAAGAAATGMTAVVAVVVARASPTSGAVVGAAAAGGASAVVEASGTWVVGAAVLRRWVKAWTDRARSLCGSAVPGRALALGF